MFLILSIFLLITGCSEEETKQQENSIYGQWSLIKYEPGLAPTENFSVNQISWDFKHTNILKIQIDNTGKHFGESLAPCVNPKASCP